MLQLICPNDSSLLEETCAGVFRCPSCIASYANLDGVVQFLHEQDDFYEGAYLNKVAFKPRSERLWHAWPLWLISNGFLWTVRKHVPAGATVVELGCASGVDYFAARYKMIGCDVSLSSLKRLAYQHRIQADASQCIPLQDNSVDAVISSYFWEHMPPDIKPAILKECNRVLRPGGKIIFLYDVETQNPLMARYKKVNPELYKQLFIDGDGHLGYQTPAENARIFQSQGFQIADHRGMEKTFVQSASAYEKLRKFDDWPATLFYMFYLAGRTRLFYFYTVFVRLIDVTICRLLPNSWARIEISVCEKRAGISDKQL